VNIEKAREVLELLRSQGVKRAVFAGDEIAEVEFLGTPAPADAENELGESVATTDDTAPYVRALEQVRKRRFVGKGVD
jgi:hypothetical protein